MYCEDAALQTGNLISEVQRVLMNLRISRFSDTHRREYGGPIQAFSDVSVNRVNTGGNRVDKNFVLARSREGNPVEQFEDIRIPTISYDDRATDIGRRHSTAMFDRMLSNSGNESNLKKDLFKR